VDVDWTLVSFFRKSWRKLRLALRRRVDVFLTSAVGAGGNVTAGLFGSASGESESTQPSGV
jgi:hypothetical protein